MSSLDAYAKLVGNVVDVISYYPDREKITETAEVPILGEDGEPTGETETVEVGWHWGDVTPEWVAVPPGVYAGFRRSGRKWLPPEASDPPVPTSYTIAKSTPWVRMTEEEAEKISAAIAAAPARLRGIYDAAINLSTEHELWPQLRNTIATVLGSEARADELLGPEISP